MKLKQLLINYQELKERLRAANGAEYLELEKKRKELINLIEKA